MNTSATDQSIDSTRRAVLDAQRKHAALRDLSRVLDGGAAHAAITPTGAPPVLAAMTVIGRELGVDVQAPGSTARDDVEAIARHAHLRARRVTLSGRWWRRDCGVLLGFEGDARRPAALVRSRGPRYQIVDPARGTQTVVTRRRASELAADAWLLYRPLPERQLRLGDLLRFAVAGRRAEITLALLAGFLATALGMLVPLATAMVMDTAIPDADRRLLLEIGGGLLAVACGQVVFRLAQGLTLLRVSIASGAETQAAIWDRVLQLPTAFFRRFSSGDLLSRVQAVGDVTRQLSGATLTSLLSGGLTVLYLGVLWIISPALTALALAIAAIVAGFAFVVGVFVRKNLCELVELDGRLSGIVVQLIGGVGKLRVAGAADRAYTHWLGKYAEALGRWSTTIRLQDRVSLCNGVVPSLSLVLLLTLAHGTLTGNAPGGLTLGSFLAFSAAFGVFLSGVVTLSNTAVTLLDVSAAAHRIRPILDAAPESQRGRTDPGRLAGAVELRGVTFSYTDGGRRIVDDINLRAAPGELVAIVGPSGSGKSTLLRLLLGFEGPDAGTVAYDGRDLAHLDAVAVRRQIGVVLQHGRLDAGTVFENIAGGHLITLGEAWSAAEQAGFADDIRALPMGMHTIVSAAGGNLSGGQRQRLLLARALAHRPRLLLLDEATSALDNAAQEQVARNLAQLGMTRIVIAHRLSTIRRADRIYVLEDGRVAQEGTFEALMSAQDGPFARMMRRQLA